MLILKNTRPVNIFEKYEVEFDIRSHSSNHGSQRKIAIVKEFPRRGSYKSFSPNTIVRKKSLQISKVFSGMKPKEYLDNLYKTQTSLAEFEITPPTYHKSSCNWSKLIQSFMIIEPTHSTSSNAKPNHYRMQEKNKQRKAKFDKLLEKYLEFKELADS